MTRERINAIQKKGLEKILLGVSAITCVEKEREKTLKKKTVPVTVIKRAEKVLLDSFRGA